MTPEQILAAARLSGGTAYTNRHYPGETAMAFSHAKLMDFVAAIEAATRAECARVCRDMQNGFASDKHIECAEAIEKMA